MNTLCLTDFHLEIPMGVSLLRTAQSLFTGRTICILQILTKIFRRKFKCICRYLRNPEGTFSFFFVREKEKRNYNEKIRKKQSERNFKLENSMCIKTIKTLDQHGSHFKITQHAKSQHACSNVSKA